MKQILDFKTRHAGSSAFLSVVILTSLIIINLVAGRLGWEADLTQKQLYSLSEGSYRIIEEIKTPSQIYALYKTGEEMTNVVTLLEQYEESSPLISVETIDPDRNPGLVASFSEEGDSIAEGSLIVVSGNYSRIIGPLDLYDYYYDEQGQPQLTGFAAEQKISSALSYVATGEVIKVYQLTGHNESSFQKMGYSTLFSQANIELESLDLNKETNVPEDADLITILAPFYDLNDSETEKLINYAKTGGSFFLAVNITPQALVNFNRLLQAFDMQIQHGFVMEGDSSRLLSQFGNVPYISIPRILDHETVSVLNENDLDPIFITSVGITQTDARQKTIKYYPLLESSSESWLRKDINSQSMEKLPEDLTGPIVMAAASEQLDSHNYQPTGSRLGLIGSARSLEPLQDIGQIRANGELMMSLIKWTSGSSGQVSLDSKSLYKVPVRMSALQAYIYAGVVVILYPLILLGLALFIWFRRRHL